MPSNNPSSIQEKPREENQTRRGRKAELPPSGKWLKRFIVALFGGTVLVLGVAMIFLPGPALIVIPAGLAILATEFLWARRALRQCKGVVVRVKRQPWFRRFRRWRKGISNSV